MYREIEGDLIKLFKEDEFDVIAHGCNCQSKMGAGIAKQIALEFPLAWKKDAGSKLLPNQKLGHYSIANTPNGLVLNLYTQYNPGPNFNPTAFKLSLQKLKMVLGGGIKIGLPLIGCGIGGGSWKEVKAIIVEELSFDFDVTVVMYNKEKTKK